MTPGRENVNYLCWMSCFLLAGHFLVLFLPIQLLCNLLLNWLCVCRYKVLVVEKQSFLAGINMLAFTRKQASSCCNFSFVSSLKVSCRLSTFFLAGTDSLASTINVELGRNCVASTEKSNFISTTNLIATSLLLDQLDVERFLLRRLPRWLLKTLPALVRPCSSTQFSYSYKPVILVFSVFLRNHRLTFGLVAFLAASEARCALVRGWRDTGHGWKK